VAFIMLLSYPAYHWYSTQPVKIARLEPDNKIINKSLHVNNQKVITLIEAKGKTLAPTYAEVVCTDYVINVLHEFYLLTKAEKRAIQIITSEDLKTLIAQDAPIIKGVYTALIDSGKGVPVERDSVQAGDFVQFWNVMPTGCYGHCGVVKSIDDQTLTLYSSHPMTNGFGIHTFRFPDKAYFVRLK
ncbi:MAG: hypothetical protein ACK4TA_14215, partial [Saprospiraceae bacterium]